MSQSIGLAVVVSAQTDPLARGLKGAEGMIAKFDKAASGGGNVTFNNITNSLKDVRAEAARTETALGRVKRIATAGLVGGFFGAAGVAGFGSLGDIADAVGDSVKLASEFEKTQGAFEVMLGSAERAKDVIGDIRKFGADSPFNFAGLTETAKQLSAYGVAGDQLVPTLRMLGEAAVGDQEKLGRLAYAYGQVKAAGRLYGTELRQFTETGLPINKALAGVLTNPDGSKVQEESVKTLVEEGRVGFSDLVKAFKSMTEEGGQFFGMTDKYAKTFAGSMERVKDAVDLTKQEFGTALIEELGLKDATKDLEAFSDRLRKGINDIRPWIRAAGEMGRGVIQVGYEFSKAGLNIAGGYIERLVDSIPELGQVRQILTSIGNSPDGFRIDPIKAKELGNAFAVATEGIFTNIIAAGKEFKTSVVDPILAAVLDMRATADYLRRFGQSASDMKKAVFGEGQFDESKNQVLAGRTQRRRDQVDTLMEAIHEQEARVNAAAPDFLRWQKVMDDPWQIPSDKSTDEYFRAKQIFDEAKGRLTGLQNDAIAREARRAEVRASPFQFGPQAADAWGPGTVEDGRVVGGYQFPDGQGWKSTSLESVSMPREAASPWANGVRVFGFALDNLAVKADKAAAGLQKVEVPDQIPPLVRMAAENANKQFRNPFDVFKENQANLTGALDRGLIKKDVFDKAVAENFQDLARSAGVDREFQLPGAMEFGSSAAASTIANQRGGPSIPSLLEAIARSSEENARLADGILRQLAAAEQSVPVVLPR